MCDQQSLRSACAYVQSDQSLCLSLEYSMTVKLLTEHHLKFLRVKGGCTGSSESTLVKMPHCWKSHVTAHSEIINFEPLILCTMNRIKPDGTINWYTKNWESVFYRYFASGVTSFMSLHPDLNACFHRDYSLFTSDSSRAVFSFGRKYVYNVSIKA